MHCYTSITNNYFPKARVLAETLKRHNPDWKIHVILSEPLHPSIDPAKEQFDSIVRLEELGIPMLKGFIFKHRITEICTAVKGLAAIWLIEKYNTDRIIYFDPDIAVFGDLSALDRKLDEHPILLAPHQCKPESKLQTIMATEIGSLRWGVFNLGFMAARYEGQGKEFLKWWSDRLLEFCYDDIPYGLFTDQRWCDLAPAFFDQLHVLRDPQYDVASWNLSQRTMSMNSDGRILVDGYPLGFYHFSGYDSDAGWKQIQHLIHDRQHCIYDVWEWYLGQLARHGQNEIGDVEWHYARFANKELIHNDMRRIYAKRNDLQRAFMDPFAITAGQTGFYEWWQQAPEQERTL